MTAPDPVAIRDVSIALAGRPVVRRADLTVGTGAFVALLGSNGSGKSTLMRAAVGLIPYQSGSIELFGTPVADFTERQRIGYVPQKSSAVAGVPSTIREVVMSGRLARRPFIGLATRADRKAVDDAIELVGLADRARDSAALLSGGQQQRVMIARGLAGGCDLLVMDEPLAGVDQHSQEVLAVLFQKLLDSGTSIWMIAHELGTLRHLIDQAVVLQDGQVVYTGSEAGYVDDHHADHHPHLGSPTRQPGVTTEGVWNP
ncbi:MAG: transporter [Aeromicrobium sp.]|nr:transporter [Aeromicrobium sp.]